MSEAAQAVVRRYLGALMAGDEDGAYAALGGAAGARGFELKEGAFLSRDARIASLRTRQAGAGSATVDAEIVTATGTYAVTFHVTNRPNGAVIDAHDYIRE
jgi:hypothetical protein